MNKGLTKLLKLRSLVSQSVKTAVSISPQGQILNPSGKTVKMTCREAIRSAMIEEMERNDKVFIMGEEIGKFQGTYKVTKGMVQRFGPRRVITTPISEMGFTGMAVGAAYYGLHPIVEFMTMNFALQSIDHIIQNAAKHKYMSGGDISVPIVFRGLNGAEHAVAAQHTQCYAPMYSAIPGLIVMTPADPIDARGLMKAALRTPDPVIYLESESLYGKAFEVPEEVADKDFVLPIGKADIARKGNTVTVTVFTYQLGNCLQAANDLAKEGIECEVINLRCVRPLDRKTIVESVKKTNRLVTVEESWPHGSVGAEIAASIFESSAFDYLDAPVERVTGFDVPMAYAPNLEAASLPRIDDIKSAIKKAVYRK